MPDHQRLPGEARLQGARICSLQPGRPSRQPPPRRGWALGGGWALGVPAEERDYVQAIRAAPDAETKIAIYASAMRMIAGRLGPVLGIIQQAAPAEPELAALWREITERRAANMRRFAADLAAVAALRVELDEAADIVWATNAPELYQLLVYQRGWTPEHYEHFLADTWRRLLLAG